MAKEYSYTVLIERDVESGDYIAYAPAFDGCVVQMKTYEEALAEIKEVLKDYIQDYISDGEELPREDLSVKNLTIAI
jgi:predicted RNase H-like HicB family nuclease